MEFLLDEENSSDLETELTRPSITHKSALNYLFKFNEDTTSETNSILELKNFLDESQVGLHINPQKWWRDNKQRFLQIAEIAAKVLSIPPFSTHPNRVFSKMEDCLCSKGQFVSEKLKRIDIFI